MVSRQYWDYIFIQFLCFLLPLLYYLLYWYNILYAAALGHQ